MSRIAQLTFVAVVAGCGGSSNSPGGTLVIAVDAPFSRSPYIGETIANGAELAADTANATGGVVLGGKVYKLRIKRYDNALSARRSVDKVRRAIADGAVALIADGTGIDAAWTIARDGRVPLVITYDGGMGLVDPQQRPNVFRIAPTDRGIAFRLAEYTIPKGYKLALLHDDTSYGEEGGHELARAFGANPESVALSLTLPSGSSDLSPQILRARRAGATALLVWGQPSTIAETLVAARSAGWNAPVFAPPSAEDPVLRQQLANRPEWLDGLTFASGRMTAELGPGFFYAFQSQYEAAYGPQRVGVRTGAGKNVVTPPEYAMYSYDAVNVITAALRSLKSRDGDLVHGLEQVSVRGANGDERGFNQRSHEGVVDDDVYFARFRDMTFRPVRDDPLSSTLPTILQTR